MNILMATNNKGKVRELSALLDEPGLHLMTLSEAGFEVSVTEDGKTFEENALKKAMETYRITGMPSLGDDSGLCVDALGGAPGIYSARWAGEGASGEALIKKLLSELKDNDNRGAEFVCSIALVFSENDIITASGKCRGLIDREPHGEGGFGYDPVFYVPEVGRTFAEMTKEEKNLISHRAMAAVELKKKLKMRKA